MSDITERVERGAALLDEKRPGWDRLIDLERLDVRSTCNCIGGQLSGDLRNFSAAMESLELDSEQEFVEHGFESDIDLPGRAFDAEYDILTAAWRDLIAGRRAAAEVPA